MQQPSMASVRRHLGCQGTLAEHPPAEVGERICEEGGDEDVDEERAAVERQLAEQDGVGEREPDPDQREHRHRHRPGHVPERWPGQREDQHHRDRRDERKEDLEGGSEVGGGDHAEGAEERGGLERARTRRHPEELDLRAPGEADHRDGEDRAADRDDEDGEEDPRDCPEDAGHRFGVAGAPAAAEAAAPWSRLRFRCGRRVGDRVLLAGFARFGGLGVQGERRSLRRALPLRPRRTWSRGKVHSREPTRGAGSNGAAPSLPARSQAAQAVLSSSARIA